MKMSLPEVMYEIDVYLKDKQISKAKQHAIELHAWIQSGYTPYWPSHPRVAAFYGQLIKDGYFTRHLHIV